ncbi:hypothetical protein E2C01_062797 [Portunus trituberculatus]|uniref:Uncharacterized protein n=1 Tax=Portunus trituberculatus TaxID=210409 RepID=A0A5B7HGE3_PORTR|nr:hypothetical protein [Portunus trituberculatus]
MARRGYGRPSKANSQGILQPMSSRISQATAAAQLSTAQPQPSLTVWPGSGCGASVRQSPAGTTRHQQGT